MNEKPANSREDSKEDDDDEDEDDEDSSTQTTNRSRRLARLSLNGDKEAPPNRKEERVAGIIDSLFKEKAKESDEDDEDKEKDQDEVEEPDEVTPLHTSEETQTAELDVPADSEVLEADDTDLLEEDPVSSDTSTVEPSGDWEEEGELGEDAEIQLQTPPAHEASEREEDPEKASIEEHTEEERLEEAAGDGGETPPPDIPEDTPEPEPEPRHTPRPDASGSGGYFPPYGRERTRTPAEDAREYEDALNDATYYAEKRGQNHGVVAGLAAGLYIGHRRKKKQGKEYEAKLQGRDTEIKKLGDEQYAAKERIQALKRNQETIQSALVEQAKNPSQALSEASKPRHEADKPFIASILEREADEPQQQKLAEASRYEKQPDKKLPPEDREITEEMYKPGEGKRVESSIWHRIEIDAKTGHTAENPDVEYGEEFRSETRREILAAAKDDAQAAAVQLGSMATTASSMGSDSSAHIDTPSAHHLAQKTDSQSSSHMESSKATDAPKQATGLSMAAKDPIIWGAGVALIIILIILASIL